MPDLKFSLDLGAFIQPLLLICFALVVNQARKAVITHLDKRHDETETNVAKRHAETTEHLDRIEVEVKTTNGRVTKVETRQDEQEKKAEERDAKRDLAMQADHDLLYTIKGNVESLMSKPK